MKYQQAKRLPTLILLAALTAITTILICYLSSHYFTHYPKEHLWLPVISLTGYKAPEYYFYAIGFTVTGILFIYCSYYIHFVFLPMTKLFTRAEIYKLFVLLLSGIICFIIHAIVPLQDDILTAKELTFGCQLHQSCAGIFFLLVILHTTYIFSIVKKKENTFDFFDRRALKIRASCAIGSALTVVVSMGIHPTTKILFGDKFKRHLMSIGALAQWILVGSIIIIFTSYCMDIQKMLPKLYEEEQQKKK